MDCLSQVDAVYVAEVADVVAAWFLEFSTPPACQSPERGCHLHMICLSFLYPASLYCV